jgi:hypothetical protein
MKAVIALVALVVSSTALANTYKGPKDTTDFQCYDLIHKINQNGWLSLTTNGADKTTYAADQAYGNNCSNGTDTVFVQTADFQGCPLNVCHVKKN